MIKEITAIFPEKKIMNETEQKQINNGIDQNKINEEQLKFSIFIADFYYSQYIQDNNKRISEGIKNLSMCDHWSNLLSISKHAIEESINIIEKSSDKDSMKNLQNTLKLKKMILNMGSNNFKNIFKKDFLNKNFPGVL